MLRLPEESHILVLKVGRPAFAGVHARCRQCPGGHAMSSYATATRSLMALIAAATGLAAHAIGGSAIAQTAAGTVEEHVAAAKAAAGTEHVALFDSLCKPAAG